MENLKTLLFNAGTSFKKAYGQNFLSDETLLDDIVEKAGVEAEDTVLEIGCGAGTLTRAISKKAKKVYGYEIDKSLSPILNKVVEDCKNVEIIYKDALKEDLKAIEKLVGGKYKIVANLPYYITTPLVMKFIENSKNVKSLSIMVQEEVADRFCAKAGESEYGAITVGINLRGSAKIVKYVGREMFTPRPNVDSAVVRIDIEDEKYKGVDFNAVREVVRIAFSSRRKMLVNNLMNGYKINRDTAEKLLNNSGIPLTSRGETLTEKQFITLSSEIKEMKGNV